MDSQAGSDGVANAACGFARIVKIGNFSSDHVAHDVGIIGLPLAGGVVPTNEGGGYGIEKAVVDRAVAEAEVTRILVKDGRQNRIAESVAYDVIGVSGCGAFCESEGAPAEAGGRVIGFANACD